MSKHSIALFIFTFVFCATKLTLVEAQEFNDAGLWTTINAEKKFKNNFAVFMTEEFRLKENFSRLNLFYTDAGVSYRPYKFLKVSIAYRFIQKYLIDDSFSFRHRLMLDIQLKKKYGATTFTYRQRLQSEVRNVYSSENGAVPEWYSRNKFEGKVDLNKKIFPYLSAEFRFQFHNPRIVESDETWHRARYAAGIDYEQNKRITYGLYYLVQQEFNVSAPQNLYIVGLEYSVSF